MARTSVLDRLKIDPFILGILASVGIAILLPARGSAAGAATIATDVAIGLLFFLYGARLSPAEAAEGLKHWRLHVTVLASTFVLFPLLGLALRVLVPTVLTPALYAGLLFLCTLPSTVQSSIAFTSIAKGNVAAALCSASLSSMLGVFISPVLVGLLVTTGGNALSPKSLLDVVLQLLVPFLLGQLSRRWIAGWVTAHGKPLKIVDRGSILLVVYTAFSEGIVAGIWHQLQPIRFVAIVGADLLLLVLALVITWTVATRLKFNREDRITIVFCGSKKSLAAGLPMAAVLFASQGAGVVALIVLPLMLFHQIQLMVCAALARRWSNSAPEPDAAAEEPTTPAIARPGTSH
jgi:sodium/bile acid cotransporter 7